MNLKNKVFCLANNKEYLVIANVNYKGREYVYLVNNKDEQDAMFREVFLNDEKIQLKEIDKEVFDKSIFKLFSNCFMDIKE